MRGYFTNDATGLTTLPTREVDVDFGALPVVGNGFAIVDSDVTPSSRILAQTSLNPGIGKDQDEVEMEMCLVTPYLIGNGTFNLFVRTIDGSYLEGAFKLTYQVSQ